MLCCHIHYIKINNNKKKKHRKWQQLRAILSDQLEVEVFCQRYKINTHTEIENNKIQMHLYRN